MLIAIDKRGSINLPAALRRQLGLEIGSYFGKDVKFFKDRRDGGEKLFFRNRTPVSVGFFFPIG
jgi:bifunctional DNA-binding transcriptional regulator/antitoxin component of YhaV-PrlF toxin-antitoxin module